MGHLCPAHFPIAYAIHVKKIPALRLSAACRGIIGDNADGLWGKLIDTVVIFGMIGGVGPLSDWPFRW